MSSTNYAASLRHVLAHEGGNDDDPRDPGGRTSRGILQSEWTKWRKTHPGLPSDVFDAPQDQIEAIYREQYWAPLRCDDLPSGVDYCVFDYGILAGISRSAKVLQRFVGSGINGEIGPLTIAATARVDARALVTDICDERLAFLKGLRTWPTFGKGWGARVADVKRDALAMVGAVNSPPIPAKPAENTPPAKGLVAEIGRLLAPLFTSHTPTPPEVAPGAKSAPTGSVEAPKSLPAAPLWFEWAKGEVGFHERGQNLGIEKYITLAQCGSLGDPWCAIFANAGLERAGIRGTRSPAARSFEHDSNFVKLSGPAIGAITTMWRGSPSAGTGHVFYYAGENADGIVALGGNQDDQVCFQLEPRNRVVGYYWPKAIPLPKLGAVQANNKGIRTGGSEV